MGKDKETKKLDAEELEKREAPFMPIVDSSGGGGGGTAPGTRRFTPSPGSDPIEPSGPGGGAAQDPILDKPRP
ncbi:MAG: hypothetical protein ACE5HU_08550 [Acidobacteriota bacterium]